MDEFDMLFFQFVNWFADGRKSRHKSRWKKKLMRERKRSYNYRKQYDPFLSECVGVQELIRSNYVNRM